MSRADRWFRWIVGGGLVLVAAIASIAIFRWSRWDPTPLPESDLDVPRLFTGTELRFEDVARQDPSGIPILCYHYFRGGVTVDRLVRVLGAVLFNMPSVPDHDYWTTPLPEFERQMRYLAEEGYTTLTLDELADHLDGIRDAPNKSVVLTIDDGDDSFVEFAVPVLRRYGFHATLFLLTGRAGERNWNGLDLVDWETLRELELEGVIRVESHTHRLHDKVRISGRWVPRFLLEARDESGVASVDSPMGYDLRASLDALRTHLGRESRYLAWPFGYGNATVDSLAHTVGMRRILTLRPRRNLPDFQPTEPESLRTHGLGRYAVTARTSFRLFRMMVRVAES